MSRTFRFPALAHDDPVEVYVVLVMLEKNDFRGLKTVSTHLLTVYAESQAAAVNGKYTQEFITERAAEGWTSATTPTGYSLLEMLDVIRRSHPTVVQEVKEEVARW